MKKGMSSTKLMSKGAELRCSSHPTRYLNLFLYLPIHSMDLVSFKVFLEIKFSTKNIVRDE